MAFFFLVDDSLRGLLCYSAACLTVVCITAISTVAHKVIFINNNRVVLTLVQHQGICSIIKQTSIYLQIN